MKKLRLLLSESYEKLLIYIASIFIIVFLYNLFLVVLESRPELSGLPYALTKALIGVITLKFVDELLLYEVPTMKLLKENATGYSIYVFAYALVIALSIANA